MELSDPSADPASSGAPGDEAEERAGGEAEERAGEEAAPRLGRSIGLGVVIGAATGLIVFFLTAIPIYTVASFEANGIDRPIIRTGLFKVALPIGVVVAVVVSGAVGRWLYRGGTWPTSEAGDRYSAR